MCRGQIFKDAAAEKSFPAPILGDERDVAPDSHADRSNRQRNAVKVDAAGRVGNQAGKRPDDRRGARADLR